MTIQQRGTLRSAPPPNGVTALRTGFTDAELTALLPNLRRCAGALRLHGADAEDFVQDAAERALRYRDRYVPTEPLVRWLSVLAHRTFYARRRHENRRAEFERDAALPTPSPDPEAQRYAAEVAAAFAALPEAQRLAILASAYGVPVPGLPIGTQRSRAARGRAELRRRTDRDMMI